MGGLAHQDSWRQRICFGHQVILLLMGLLAVVTLSLIILGFVGRNYSTTLLKMQEDVKTSNRTMAAELAALQQKETNNLKTLQKVDQMVKNLTEEAKEVRSQFLDQINKLQGTLQKVKSDLEDTKHQRKGPATGCYPRGWHLFERGCYWVSSARKPWTEAKADCEEKNAHLVVITSYLEAQFVLRLAKPYNVWIGLKYNDQVWKWVDGTAYTVRRIDWKPHEPNQNSSFCTIMYRDGLWTEVFCEVRLQWVCEKQAQL